MDISTGITTYIKAVLAESARHKAAVEARMEEIRAGGGRIVSGGAIRSYPDGLFDYEVTDAMTGEVVISGHGTSEDLTAAWQPGYWDRDAVDESVPYDYDPPRPQWMSAKLASGLQEVVWEHEDEVRALLG